jgi:fimbrial chaperone protein
MLRVCIITLVLWSPAVLAQGLQIMPVSLSMQSGTMSNTLYITNRGSKAETVQARPFLWSQSSSGDVLTPTEDVVVSPPMTVVAPGATQLFRVLLREPAEKTETCYRLLFDELPAADDEAGGVRLTVRLSVPLFALPEQAIKSMPIWSVIVDGNRAFLHAENQGTQHLRIIHLMLNEGSTGEITVSAAASRYLLAGAEQEWPLPEGRRPAPGSVLHLTAGSDQGPVDATVHVQQR